MATIATNSNNMNMKYPLNAFREITFHGFDFTVSLSRFCLHGRGQHQGNRI